MIPLVRLPAYLNYLLRTLTELWLKPFYLGGRRALSIRTERSYVGSVFKNGFPKVASLRSKRSVQSQFSHAQGSEPF